jgi:hypothetical protein
MLDGTAGIALTLALSLLACACSIPDDNALEIETLSSRTTLADAGAGKASENTAAPLAGRPSVETPRAARRRIASRRLTQPVPIKEFAEPRNPAPETPSSTGLSNEEITTPVAAAADHSSATGHERENEPSMRSTRDEIRHDLDRYGTPYPPPERHPGVAHEGEVKWVSLSTRSEATRVAINFGAAVGVRVGQAYDIVRGADFICTIRIDAVRAYESEGVIELSMPRRSPQRGNRVTVL